MTAFTLVSLFVGCTPSTKDSDTGGTLQPSDDAPPGELVHSSLARELAPSTAGLPTLAHETNQFGWELTQLLWSQDPDADRALSSWSLGVAFAQAYAGADSPAKTAVAGLFHWDLAEPALHEAFDAAWLAVDGHTDPSADEPVTVQTTSQVFADDHVTIDPTWLDTVGTWYGTGAALLDLDGDPSGSAAAINGWVSDRTAGLIPTLVSEEVVGMSALILVNCVYFAASWEVPFPADATTDAPFTLRDGTVVDVPTMMAAELATVAYEGDGYVLFDLPFTDDGLRMTLVLPDAGRFIEVVGGLDWATLEAGIAAEDTPAKVLQLPKFSIDDTPPVQEALLTLGGPDVFGGYTGIAPDLTLTGVDHHAVIEATESGVVAAAATALEFSDSASVPPDLQIAVDRPFVWMLRDESSGMVLFSGMLLDPR